MRGGARRRNALSNRDTVSALAGLRGAWDVGAEDLRDGETNAAPREPA